MARVYGDIRSGKQCLYSDQRTGPHIGLPLPNGKRDPSDIDEPAGRGRDDSRGGNSYEYLGCYGSSLKFSSGPHALKYRHPLAHHHKRNSDFKLPPGNIALVFDNDGSWDMNGDNQDDDIGCVPAKEGGGDNCPQSWDNHGARGMNMMSRRSRGFHPEGSRQLDGLQLAEPHHRRMWIELQCQWLD